MKPDWKDAPEWANYLAMDNDNRWFWYEEKPDKDISYWKPKTNTCFDQANEDVVYWRDALQKRPSDEKT